MPVYPTLPLSYPTRLPADSLGLALALVRALLRRPQHAVRWLICLLLGCGIPLQGTAMVVQRIEGAAHVHLAAATSRFDAPVSPRDHAPLPPGMPQLLSIAEHRHSHGAARMPVDDDTVLLTGLARRAAAMHSHVAVAHHAHEASDATVLSVDVPADGPDAAKRVLLDVDAPPVMPTVAAVEVRPSPVVPARSDRPAGTGGGRLERPPRHAQR